jgi:hypothetical protein
MMELNPKPAGLQLLCSANGALAKAKCAGNQSQTLKIQN